MVVLAVALPSGRSADAAAAVTTFCDDTSQLQSWIAQDLQPGIDQYNQNPNRAYVRTMAQYLQKLAAEAPQPAKADLTEWAGFTEKVADGAGQAELARDVPNARAAAARIKAWLPGKSGCQQLYSESAPVSANEQQAHKVRSWVIGGVAAFLLLIILLGAGARRSGGGKAVQRAGQQAGRPDLSFGGQAPQSCGRCGGQRTERCSVCGGRGRIDTNDSGRQAEFASSTGTCYRCSGTGNTSCSGCGGTGVQR